MGADKELYKLELLSLVSRVSQELFNHTKLQDKNLAEFVIAVGHNTTSPLPSFV
jgi:ATP-dependent RNA helicase DHX8/PRP22